MIVSLIFIIVALFVCPPVYSVEPGKIVVAVEANWPPMEYVDENGAIVGFSVDYVNAVAREAGFVTEYVSVPWEGIFEGLLAGEYDMVASSVSITPEREAVMDFTIPYYDVRQALVTCADAAIRRREDLSGKTLGVQVATTGHFAAEKMPDATIAAFEEIGQALEALERNELDAVLADDPVATSYILKMRSTAPKMKIAFILPSESPEYYGFAVKKGNARLLERLNRGIMKVQEKGIDGGLRRKWIGF